MKLPQTGGCQCGQVRYEITEEPQSVYRLMTKPTLIAIVRR
jgi:hypothetical protein